MNVSAISTPIDMKPFKVSGLISQEKNAVKTTKTKRQSQDSMWKKRIAQLKEYRAINGNVQVPHHYKENTALGA